METLQSLNRLEINELYFNKVNEIETTISGIIVTGTTDTDNFINTGISTFVGIITASATQNVIPFLFNAWSDIPSASSYHGAFIHVHGRGKDTLHTQQTGMS